MQHRQHRGNSLFEANGRRADLSQADVFYNLGHFAFLDAKLQPLIVNELLGARSLVGLTCDQLIHQHGKSRLSLQMASFFCSLPIENLQLWLSMGFNKISHTAVCHVDFV